MYYNCRFVNFVEGSYECEKCSDGFDFDENGHCIDFNECLTNLTECDSNADCLNTFGSFICSCRHGFYGTGFMCQKGSCSDYSCPTNQKCVTPTSIACKCEEGFSVDKNGDCLDVDECLNENDICPSNANCTNTVGDYSGSMHRGLFLRTLIRVVLFEIFEQIISLVV